MSKTDTTPGKSFELHLEDENGLTDREVTKIKDNIGDLLLGANLNQFHLSVEGETLWQPEEQETTETADETEPETEAVETETKDRSADETAQERYESQRETVTDEPDKTEAVEEPTEVEEPDPATVEADDEDETDDENNVKDLWGKDLTELQPDEFEDALSSLTDDEKDYGDDPDEAAVTCYECDTPITHINNGSDHPTCPECGKNPLPPVGSSETHDEDVSFSVHGDTSQWDDDLNPSQEYLKRLDNGEDINPEALVPSVIHTTSTKWKALGLLARSHDKLKPRQIHELLSDTDWEPSSKSNLYNGLWSLKKDGLIDGSGNEEGYFVTQLGIDYATVKNLTTEGHDLAVAEQIMDTDTDDENKQKVAT
jgi:hypothetical protein